MRMYSKMSTVISLLFALFIVSTFNITPSFAQDSPQLGNILKLTGHTKPVNSVAFSPDGKTIASGSWDDTVRLWDVETGTLVNTLTGHTGWISSVAFSPDGNTIATTSADGTILLWRHTPTTEAGPGALDINGDGQLNVLDLVAVAAAPAALRQPGAAHLTPEDVQHWLTLAEQAALTDATSVKGIRFLEQLLAALTPKETALLPNYPNLFNPETWIPYQLATPADVSLTIYDIQGRVVRNLDLGYQRAGIYQSRARAAYWDGKNAVGEPVASGVYFYTLTAGDFTATRKMLIRK